MSTIGKILLVLNLVLAGAFVGYASLSLGRQEEIKKQNTTLIDTLRAEKTKLEKDLGDSRTAANTERQTKDEAISQRNNLQAEKTRLEGDLERARAENTTNSATLKTLTESVAEFSGKLEKIAQEKDQALAAKEAALLKTAAAERRADEAETAQRNAEEAKTIADREIENLRKSVSVAKKEITKLETNLDSLVKFTGVAASDITAQAPIDATVAFVDHKTAPGLVQLNKGKDDGVKLGYVFDVWQGSTYKGQVKVDAVYKNSCAGTVVNPKPGALIAAGDNASTRL